MRDLSFILKVEINCANKIFTTTGTQHVYANLTPLHFKFHIFTRSTFKKNCGQRKIFHNILPANETRSLYCTQKNVL